MKKFFFSLVAATMAATGTVFAQGSMLATLSHEGNISAYYGADALKTAMAEAEAGDIITLSSGQFNAVDIDKPITLRGAGMSVMADSVSSHQPTVIDGSLEIKIDESQSSRLLLEGLYFKNGITYSGTIKNAQFLKCRFYNMIYSDSKSYLNSVTFVHCRFCYGFRIGQNSSAFLTNCIVGCPTSTEASSSIEFQNCFVSFYDEGRGAYGNDPGDVEYSTYRNCIIQATFPLNIPKTCSAYNCICLGENTLFENMPTSNNTNTYILDITSLFKQYQEMGKTAPISDGWNFTLTDEAAAQYLGTDGTQVGIYGGNLPYNEEISIPQITKCNVASKSSADGKLSVDIEVKAAEY